MPQPWTYPDYRNPEPGETPPGGGQYWWPEEKPAAAPVPSGVQPQPWATGWEEQTRPPGAPPLPPGVAPFQLGPGFYPSYELLQQMGMQPGQPGMPMPSQPPYVSPEAVAAEQREWREGGEQPQVAEAPPAETGLRPWETGKPWEPWIPQLIPPDPRTRRAWGEGLRAVGRGIGAVYNWEPIKGFKPVKLGLSAFQQLEHVAEIGVGRAAQALTVMPEEGRAPTSPAAILETAFREVEPESQEWSRWQLARIHWSGAERQAAALAEMRERADSGGFPLKELPREQVDEILKKHEDWVADLIGGLVVDPLNWITAGWLTDIYKRTAAAGAAQPIGLLNSAQRRLLNAPLADTADELFEAAELGIKKATGWTAKIPFVGTPNSKSLRLLSNAKDNVGSWMMKASPTEIVRGARLWREGASEAADVVGQQVYSMRGQRVRHLFQGFGTVIDQADEVWQAGAEARRAIGEAADGLKLTPSDLYRAVNAGEITDPAIVKLITDNPLALEDAWKANLMSSFLTHTKAYGDEAFGVTPPTQARRFLRWVKKAESMIWLGLNPGNAIRNVINNEMMMADGGVHGGYRLLTEARRAEVWAKYGYDPAKPLFMPARYKAGIGLADVRQPFALTRLTQRSEQWASQRALLSGFEQGWQMVVDDALGGGLPPHIMQALDPLGPDAQSAVWSIIRDSHSPQQAIKRAVEYLRPDAPSALKPVAAYIDDMAREMGAPPGALREAMGDGAIEHLSEGFQTATTKNDIAVLIEDTYKMVDDRAAKEAAEWAEVTAIVEKIRARDMGPIGILDAWDELGDSSAAYWVGREQAVNGQWELVRGLRGANRDASWQAFNARSATIIGAERKKWQRMRGAILEVAKDEGGWDIPEDKVLGLFDKLEAEELATRASERELIDKALDRIQRGQPVDWHREVNLPRRDLREYGNERKIDLRGQVDELVLGAAKAKKESVAKYLAARENALRRDFRDLQKWIEQIQTLPAAEQGPEWRKLWNRRVDLIQENNAYFSQMRRAMYRGEELVGEVRRVPTAQEITAGRMEFEYMTGQRGTGGGLAAQAPRARPQLPENLAKHRPAYSAGVERFDLEWESDVEKALYMVTVRGPYGGARPEYHDAYLKWLEEVYPGESFAQIMGRGDQVREQITAAARGKPSGTLRVAAIQAPGAAPETGRAAAGLRPGELPGMPPLEAGVGRRVTPMEVPSERTISPLFAGEQEMRAATQAEQAARAQPGLPTMEGAQGRAIGRAQSFIADPPQRQRFFGELNRLGISEEQAREALGVPDMHSYTGSLDEALDTLRASRRPPMPEGPPELAAPAVEMPAALPAPQAPDDMEATLWQMNDYIATLEESKQGFTFGHSQAFSLWDYAKGEPRRRVRLKGKLVRWEYAVDQMATEYGFDSGESFLQEVGRFINLEAAIKAQKLEAANLAKALSIASQDPAKALMEVTADLFQKHRPFTWGDESLEIAREVKEFLRDLGRRAMDDVGLPGGGGLGDEGIDALKEYMGGLGPGFNDARVASVAVGEWTRDFALLNYDYRMNYNTWMDFIFPYMFWPTTTAKNTFIRAVDQPARMAAYAKIKSAMEKATNQPGFPSRLKGSIKIPLPFLPAWMGPMFVDPLATLMPIETLRQTEEAFSWRFRGGKITGPEGEERPIGIFDTANVISGVHLPLTIASMLAHTYLPEGQIRNVMGTPPEEFGYVLPTTRAVQAVSALGREELGKVGIDVPPGGWIMEAPFREVMGVPRNETWDVYRQMRMIGSMVAEEQITMDQAAEAILTREGDIWEQAIQKAGMEAGIPRLTGGVFGVRMTVYPTGEQMQRQWSQDLRALIGSEVKRLGGDPHQMSYHPEQWDFLKFHGAMGEGSKVSQFFDTHEATEARRMLFQTPEEREANFQTQAYWEDRKALSQEYLAKQTPTAIGAPLPEDLGEWYQEQQKEIEERYPKANKESAPQDVMAPRKAEEKALWGRMDSITSKWPDYDQFETTAEWLDRKIESEKVIAETAREEWPPEFYKKYSWWVTPQGIEAYHARNRNKYGAMLHEYRKLYTDRYWQQARMAETQELEGAPDWERVDPRIGKWSQFVDKYAKQYEIDPRIIAAIIRVESEGKETAYSFQNPVKATGLMQVVPGQVIQGRPSIRDLQDPDTNIAWGVKILAGFLKAEDYDLKEALYRYSGGAAWQSRERFESVYMKKINSAYKALWGVSLGEQRQEAKEKVWSQIDKPTLDFLIDAVLSDPLYADKGWTKEEMLADLEGTEIETALTSWELKDPERAEAGERKQILNKLLYEQTPPGLYHKQLEGLAEVEAWRSGGDLRDAIAAVSEYIQSHPPVGTPEQWEEARRLNDQVLRREVDRVFGPEIYEEQNAYFAAKERNERPQPSDRLAAYWDFLHQFEADNPLWGQFYKGRAGPPQFERRGGWGGGRGKTTWMRIADQLQPTGTGELAAFFRTNQQPSAATLEKLMSLMKEYGFADWAEWLAYLKRLWQEAFGAPLARFKGRRAPVVRRTQRRW